MYALKRKTITSLKRYFYKRCGEQFLCDDVNNPPKKKPKFKDYVGYKEGNQIFYQCNQNLWFEVYKDLKKAHMSYKQFLKENGLSITPHQVYGVEHSYWMFEEVHKLTVKVIDSIATEYFDLLDKKHYDKNVDLIYQYLNAMEDKLNNIIISNEFGAYEVSTLWRYLTEFKHQKFIKKITQFALANLINCYVSNVEDILRRLRNVAHTYQLINMDQINFLKICEENKKGYIIDNVSKKEENNKVLTESVLKMKSVNGKNRTERMINKPLKYMGLVVKDSSSNKHMYAEIESGDFNKYAYFQVVEEPRSFTQTLPSGKKIDKLVFHIDNFDDGKGHDAIFVPAWMSLELVNGDVTEPCGYLVAFERNQWNNEIIKKLEALNDGCDSVIALTEKNIKGLEYHY